MIRSSVSVGSVEVKRLRKAWMDRCKKGFEVGIGDTVWGIAPVGIEFEGIGKFALLYP